jgi:hypothetical protein
MTANPPSEVLTALGIAISSGQPGVTATQAERLSPRVWRVDLSNRQRIVLKVASEDAPLRREIATLKWLRQQGCSVPAVLAVDEGTEPSWVALEWSGSETLDQALQYAPPARRAALGLRLAHALAAVEAAFALLTVQARSDRDRWRSQTAALRDLAAPWIAAAPPALAWLLGRGLRASEDGMLRAVADASLGSEPEVGSLDYHAGNVMIDGERLTFVDWPAIGVDWPERRFVQYGTATGAGLPNGNFATAIDLAAVQEYAQVVAERRGTSAREVAHAVDAHDILLHLTAAASLKMIADRTAHAERKAAWPNVEARRVRLLQHLQRRLVEDGPAEALREALRARSLT